MGSEWRSRVQAQGHRKQIVSGQAIQPTVKVIVIIQPSKQLQGVDAGMPLPVQSVEALAEFKSEVCFSSANLLIIVAIACVHAQSVDDLYQKIAKKVVRL